MSVKHSKNILVSIRLSYALTHFSRLREENTGTGTLHLKCLYPEMMRVTYAHIY